MDAYMVAVDRPETMQTWDRLRQLSQPPQDVRNFIRNLRDIARVAAANADLLESGIDTRSQTARDLSDKIRGLSFSMNGPRLGSEDTGIPAPKVNTR